MALKKIFNRGNKNITPLNTDERVLFVETFLKLEDIIPMNFGEIDGDNHTDIIGTPQYTLTSYLDFFYVFMGNAEFRDSHVEAASKMGIDLKGFKLSPIYMMKLGEYYTSFRNLSKSELKEVKGLWDGQINDSNQDHVYALEEAAFYWAESVVRALQVVDLLNLGKSQGILETEEFLNKVELNLSLNKPLVTKYFDMRRSIK